MASEEVRLGTYDAIRGLLGNSLSEAQFRRKIESLGVPMTSGI
jgi:hypothetical protein